MKKILLQGCSLLLILTLLAAPLFAAGSSEKDSKTEVTVGSKIDTEGALLGNMIALLKRRIQGNRQDPDRNLPYRALCNSCR
ncbi:MAG: hypothetical protein JEY71_10955 [Sphaerochaeta sp.]|nr:hypothetical protein [Sphaerochaeta sp.]